MPGERDPRSEREQDARARSEVVHAPLLLVALVAVLWLQALAAAFRSLGAPGWTALLVFLVPLALGGLHLVRTREGDS